MKRFKKWQAAVGGALVLASGSAMAALPAGVDAAIDTLETDGLALITAVTAVVVAFIAPAVIIKLVKRFTAKI